MMIDFSRIVCPVSLDVIADCECQNCVLARLEEDYESWKRVCAMETKMKYFIGGVAAAFFILVCVAASR